MPMIYLASRTVYATAKAAALKRVGLPYHAYEYNAALFCALENENAEQEWLAGNDVFANIRRDPHDIFSQSDTAKMYEYAFGSG